MSYRTLAVEIDHGRVIAHEAESLPEHGSALLTLLEEADVRSAARPSLKDFKPSSLGRMLRPYPDHDDDLLGEMRPDRE